MDMFIISFHNKSSGANSGEGCRPDLSLQYTLTTPSRIAVCSVYIYIYICVCVCGFVHSVTLMFDLDDAYSGICEKLTYI